MAAAQPTKHVFVTGGVASSLGKGLTASSLGNLLKARGLRVTMQKLDPYLNVDPGTMNPFQHGEVFVTDDGAETDLDVGHYERFLDTELSGVANVTTGQVYSTVVAKERRMIIGALGDRLAPPEQSEQLWRHWDRPQIHWAVGNHVMHLSRGAYLREMRHFMRELEFA